MCTSDYKYIVNTTFEIGLGMEQSQTTMIPTPHTATWETHNKHIIGTKQKQNWKGSRNKKE